MEQESTNNRWLQAGDSAGILRIQTTWKLQKDTAEVPYTI